ncbi:MAG: hypothetical protein H0V66_10575 [Bdellovibrionales bacterium]|nr:hypothetical protein [Bdellovibrionales bacterium]
MKLQELIGRHNVDMTVAHIKAFFLGVLSAERPMPFVKAVEEMMAETPEAIKELEPELKLLWDDLVKNKPAELQKLFPQSSDLKEFLATAKDQLDFYLTALSLSGTNTETCKNEDVADLIDELEDTVMDLDEYLSESNADENEGEELKELLLEAWQDYLRTAAK